MKKHTKTTAKKITSLKKEALKPIQRTLDEVELDQEISEDFRETSLELRIERPDTSVNPSQPQDRSEDLINETDPFIQQPEKDTQIPPELTQDKAYHLYEQRGGNSTENLADRFEAERPPRKEPKRKA